MDGLAMGVSFLVIVDKFSRPELHRFLCHIAWKVAVDQTSSVLWNITLARTYGVVVFDNEALSAGVIQLHERRSLEGHWITSAESGSSSNTPTYAFTLSCMLNLIVLPVWCLNGWM